MSTFSAAARAKWDGSMSADPKIPFLSTDQMREVDRAMIED